MEKIVLVTNIPAPYRVDLFYYMQTHLTAYEFHVIYTNKNEENRCWKVEENKLLNTIILESKVIKIKGKLDDRFIHLPGDINQKLSLLNPDVVIAWEYNMAAIQSLIWCKVKNKRFIHLTDGTLHSERNIGKIQKFLRKLIISNSDACIASSSKAKEKLKWWGAKEEKIFISLLTVDISKFVSDSDRVARRENQILYVGSMAPRKGLDLLIRALPYLKHNFSLHIVGNGSSAEIEKLKRLALDLKVEDRIVWCGFKSGVALHNEYCEATAFVLPTREDCFGLVLLEAFCAGVPIVASAYADGAYDIIENNYNGIIEDPFDCKAFGLALDKVLSDERMRENAINNKFDKFEFVNVSKGYIDAIEYVERL